MTQSLIKSTTIVFESTEVILSILLRCRTRHECVRNYFTPCWANSIVLLWCFLVLILLILVLVLVLLILVLVLLFLILVLLLILVLGSKYATMQDLFYVWIWLQIWSSEAQASNSPNWRGVERCKLWSWNMRGGGGGEETLTWRSKFECAASPLPTSGLLWSMKSEVRPLYQSLCTFNLGTSRLCSSISPYIGISLSSWCLFLILSPRGSK